MLDKTQIITRNIFSVLFTFPIKSQSTILKGKEKFCGKSEGDMVIVSCIILKVAPFLSLEVALLDTHMIIKSHAEAYWPLVLTSAKHKVSDP